MSTPLSRRQVLIRSALIPLGGVLASVLKGRASAADATCVNMATMGASEKSGRMDLHWTATSPNPKKTCSICAYFTGTSAGCGNCQILNGPTSVGGYCDSWSAKS
jgi:hypothetical protein